MKTRRILVVSILHFLIPCISFSQIQEGKIYRITWDYSISAYTYLIQDGKKILIPAGANPLTYASYMGYNPDQVTTVQASSLDGYPLIEIPSASPTPGSIIFPPNKTSHFPLQGINTSVKVKSRGKEILITELRGWLRNSPGNGCNSEKNGFDYTYAFELDTEWALKNGIDIQKILRVGNIRYGKEREGHPGTSPRKMVSLPIIGVELNSWGWRNEYLDKAYISPPPAPVDWTGHLSDCPDAKWPFNPKNPVAGNPPLADGQYVKMVGSLVTDHPHGWPDAQFPTWFSEFFAITINEDDEWRGSVGQWSPSLDQNDPEHFARWSEIHPPDLIEVLPDTSKKVTVRGLALCARTAATIGPIIPSCEQIEFDVFPPGVRPPNTICAYQELKGPECFYPWGEDQDNGTWVMLYPDHIHVRAKVCGGALGGSPGRIKALYRVWWAKPLVVNYSPVKFSANSVEFSISSKDGTGQTIPGEVFDLNGTKLGNTNSTFSMQTPCTILNKKKKKVVIHKPLIVINVPCQEISCNPTEKVLVVKSAGFTDAKIKVFLTKNTCN